jgi:hypothetical protein
MAKHLRSVAVACLYWRIIMMTSERVFWIACSDHASRPQHAWCGNVASIEADERESSRDESCRAALSDGRVAFMRDAGRIAGAVRDSHRTVVGALLDRGPAAHANNLSPMDVRSRKQSAAHGRTVLRSPTGNAGEEPAPLPQWMRTTAPIQPGALMPGFLIVFAALAAANGILSTVLALVWI